MKCSGGSKVCGSSSNGTQPVHSAVAGPAVGRPRSVARRANRDAARRVVADVAVDVGVDEILRRHDVALERVGELGPVARLVHLEKRRQRAVVRIERGPAKRERLDRLRLRRRLRVGVVGVDRVRHQRTVARHADVQLHRRAALDDDRFGNDRERLLRAAEFRERPVGVEPLAIEILDVGGDVGRAPGDEAVAAERDRRRAGERARRSRRSRRPRCARDTRSTAAACRDADRWRAAACRSPSACRRRPSCSSRAPRFARRRAGSRGPPARRSRGWRRARADQERLRHARPTVRAYGWSDGLVLSPRHRSAGVRPARPRPGRMLKPSTGYGGISCAMRSSPTASNQIVAQQLERIVAAQIPRHHLHPDDDVGRRSRARARSGAARTRAAARRRDACR